MSYKPKKFDKPYRPKDDRRQDRQKDDRNFVDRQSDRYHDLKKSVYNDNIRRSFEFVNEKMKKFNPKEYIGEKYKKFSEKVKDPQNKKLVQLLPAVFLSITILALKNKKLISPFIEAFHITTVNATENMSITDKALLLIYEYGIILYKNASILNTIDTAMTVLTLFLEDLPGIFTKLDSYSGISQFHINKNLVKNAVELQEELIDKPAKEKKKEEERKKEMKEQKELREAIKDLKSKLGMKDKSKPKEREALLLLKSIERLEKASSSNGNKKGDDKRQVHGRSDQYYSNKGKFTGRR
jgi:hypothetical protein